MTDLLQRFAFITQLQEAILRYDCLLETQEWPKPEYWEKIKVFEDPGSPLRLTYYKLMITAMLPIIMGIISISSWTCILYYYRHQEGPEYVASMGPEWLAPGVTRNGVPQSPVAGAWDH